MGRGLLVVRADSDAGIGAGHVARGLALAQWWQDAGGDAIVLAASIPVQLADRCRAAGVEVVPLDGPGPEELAAQVAARSPAWVSLDGYRFGPDEQAAVRGTGARVLVLDDHGHVGRYDADLVLDQNLGAGPEPYRSRSRFAVSLLGTRYALLRREFRDRKPVSADRPRVLVTLGGTPSDRIGPLRDAIQQRAGRDVEVVVADGGVDDMAALLATCSVALSAAGSTAWELCATGVPMVLVTVADNQVPVAAELARRGAAVDAGPLDSLTPSDAAVLVADLLADGSRCATLAASATAVVDGRGGERVVQAMDSCGLAVREAGAGDARFAWELANDATVRSMSYSPEPIPWDTHVAWFERRLAASDRCTFVGELDGVPVGQVRFDVEGTTAEIGVSVAARHRGRHLGALLYAHGSGRALSLASVDRVLGFIRPDNQPSVRACEAAGFLPEGEATRGGVPYVRMARERSDVLVHA